MNELNLRQRLRAAHVKRWHIVETVRPQSVAEHSFNVALIAEEICKVLEWPKSILCIQYALHHDIPEVVIGDLPTPVKKLITNEHSQYITYMGAIDPLSMAPDTIVEDIVKLADIIDAVYFITTYGIGKHAAMVREDLAKQMFHFAYDVWGQHSKYDELLSLINNINLWDSENDTGEDVTWRLKQG